MPNHQEQLLAFHKRKGITCTMNHPRKPAQVGQESKNRVNWRLISVHTCLLPQNSFLPPCQAQLKPSQAIQSQSHIHSYSSLFDCVCLSGDSGPCPFKSATWLHWNIKKIILLFLELNRLRLKLLHEGMVSRDRCWQCRISLQMPKPSPG